MIHYNEEQFRIDFPKSTIGKRIISEIPDWFNLSYSPIDYNPPTPREHTLTFNVVPFFYIQMLLEKNPKIIADIGCGINFYKKFIPEIYGVDPGEHPDVDQVDFFDREFSLGHENKYDCAMSMNAIHFISLKGISEQLRNFSRIIGPGGRGFVTLNVMRMIEMTDEQDMIQDDQLSVYIKQQVDDALPNVLAYDDYINESMDSYMNGNIRVVFEKEQ
jgi:hypothetical protein